MKKIFAIVLALTLVMSMGTTAFAAGELTDTTTTSTADVQARVSEDGSKKAVISLDVTYGDLKFTYVSENTTGLWNPTDHTYSVATDGAWQIDGDNTVEVVNHSNRDVAVAIVAKAAETETALTITAQDVDNTSIANLMAGEVDKYDDADSVTWSVEVSGTPVITSNNYEVVGSVTVSCTPLATVNGETVE